MSQPRFMHMYIEPNGYLYLIGGSSPDNIHLNSIEKLYVNDMPNLHQYSFTTLSDTLSHPKSYTRSILYKTNIYVIGGRDITPYDDIDLIDTKTDSVTLWGKLSAAITYVSPIIIGTRVYIFGGSNSSTQDVDIDVNYWQYFDVFSTLNLYSSLL